VGAANIRGDRPALQRTMEAIIAESQRTSAQGQLPGVERTSSPRGQSGQKLLPERIAELVFDVPTRRRLSELVLAPSVVDDIKEFIHEFSHSALLRENSLEPRHTILLVGPPGNGKTTLAEVLATELCLPLLSIRYDAIVDSFLGETANRFRRLTEYASLNPCVLFFDEFDAVGKDRSDVQETGEIKRVASSLLMQMDRLPTHSLIVCATNHPELLDRAVWRRFEIKLEIDRPGPKELVAWFKRFEASLHSGPIGISAEEFAFHMEGENMSEVEEFTLDVRRKLVLSRGKLTASEAVGHVLDRLKRRLKKPTQLREDGQQLSDRPAPERAKKRRTNEGKKAALPQKNPLPEAD
jgi:MoxR-like ATPase